MNYQFSKFHFGQILYLWKSDKFFPLFWPDFENMMNFYLHFGQERVNVGDCGVEHIRGQVVPNLKICSCVFCILVFCSFPQIFICCVFTLRHLNTWADPSLIPGEMPEVWGKTPPSKSIINHLYKQILLSPPWESESEKDYPLTSLLRKWNWKRISAHLSWPPRQPAGSPAGREGDAPPWLPATRSKLEFGQIKHWSLHHPL